MTERDVDENAEPSAAADAIDPDRVLTLRDGIELVPIGHEAVLYDEVAGAIHELNASAAALCALLDGLTPLDGHAARLATIFDAPADRVRTDVVEAARRLGRAGVIAGIAGGVRSTRDR